MRRILFCALFSCVGCGFFKQQGEFAFAVADHEELPSLERKFFQPRRFVKPQQKPIFENDDVLWYAYHPGAPKRGAFYGISLQKKSLGYQEIDLRNRTIGDGQDLLIDHYSHLEEGEYRIKIAYANEVIDQIDFVVVADSATETIDYETDETET